MKTVLIAAVSACASIAFVGCASSHEEGVKSNLRQQYAPVAADTMTTTEAAKSVLESKGLKQVTSTSTKVDGKAMGKMADGTDVKVDVAKNGTAGSEVTVTVGSLGSPTMGAELVKEIKMKAEGMKMDATTMPSNGM